MSKIEDEVCRKIQERAVLGLAKYGVPLADDTLSIEELLTHAQEEAMDLAIYIETVQRKITILRQKELDIYDKLNFAIDRLDKAGFKEYLEKFSDEHNESSPEQEES